MKNIFLIRLFPLARIARFELRELGGAARVPGPSLAAGKRRVGARGGELAPGGDAVFLERFEKRPGGGLEHEIGKEGIPRRVQAERAVFLKTQRARQMALHRGERPADKAARAL